MAYLNILKECKRCQGEGIAVLPIENGTVNEDPCSLCGGTGKEAPLEVDADEILDKLNDMEDKIDDMEDKIDDVMDKCNDIFEQVSEQ